MDEDAEALAVRPRAPRRVRGFEGDACWCGRAHIVTAPGETCVGFGAKPETCDPSCEQPYGYVCFDGAPPGFEGCRKVSESTLGQTDVLLSEERLRRAARSGRDVQRFGG